MTESDAQPSDKAAAAAAAAAEDDEEGDDDDEDVSKYKLDSDEEVWHVLHSH